MKSILLITFSLLSINFQSTDNNLTELNLSVQQLSKKWNLEKYEVFYYTEKPSKKEQNDYISLKSNMTFSSVSEGVYETGNWRLDEKRKRIILTKKGEKGALTFIVDAVSAQKLVLIIDDTNDNEAQYLKIHFKSN